MIFYYFNNSYCPTVVVLNRIIYINYYMKIVCAFDPRF